MTDEKRKLLYFPTVATPTIADVFAEFLKDQKKRLQPRTFRNYEEVIELFQHCLNSYAHQELTRPAELTLYEKLYFQKSMEFCAIFGPEKILAGLGTFLNYFMIRKVMASESFLRAAGTVTNRLIKWMLEKGYVHKDQAQDASRLAMDAAKQLPAAERLARLLYDYAQSHAPRYWTSELDDYFTVEAVKPGMLVLCGMAGGTGLIELRVPHEIIKHCKVGWQINLLLGKTPNGWHILETGNVYPM
ncbi:MAG: hypothetical protein AB7W37_14085 [Syntrophobacteraceae bacterium]|jgi:hypothetical protein